MVAELTKEAQKTPQAASYATIFIMSGMMIILFAFIYSLVLSATAGDYYLLSKVTRDGAEAGSTILGQLQFLHVTPGWLAPLKFVGLALLISGIGMTLYGIVTTLRTRGHVMAETLPRLLGGK